jgi:hypothetical protein
MIGVQGEFCPCKPDIFDIKNKELHIKKNEYCFDSHACLSLRCRSFEEADIFLEKLMYIITT